MSEMAGHGSVSTRPDSPAAEPHRRTLLMLEPNELTRWSVSTYLRRWFDVFVIDSAIEAFRMLDHQPLDAVIVSDDVSADIAVALERIARARNPEVVFIRTTTEQDNSARLSSRASRLEKPFELVALARMLGIRPDQG